MLIPWKPALLATLITTSISATVTSAFAESASQLPDMGTTAGHVLSIAQEEVMGNYYVRQLRASAPIINDPLLDSYINNLGGRLVAHATSVKTPFYFFLIDNSELNAFAFFGGNVVLHSALFRYVDNESQLAAVMSHEISHVTQRHLARAMEAQQRAAPLTWVGTIGSILLAMANPQAGMMALTGTLAGTHQRVISFTQQNEQEADRLGMGVLQRSGFDPQAMPAFLQKLLDLSRYATRLPEILLTHPLPESRLADARNRANQMLPVVVQSSLDFYLAKARVVIFYHSEQNQPAVNELLTAWEKGNIREQQAAQYGRAIVAMRDNHYQAADKLLQPLLQRQPDSIWFLDLATDIDIGNKQSARAVRQLRASADLQKSRVLQLNLANALLEDNQPAEAVKILNRYTFDHPSDSNAWDLLIQAQSRLGHQDHMMAARAELLALSGDIPGAINLLGKASAAVKLGSLQQARYDARIDQLRRLHQQFRQFEK